MCNSILANLMILLFGSWATETFSQPAVSTGGKDIAVDPEGQMIFIAGNESLIRSTDGGLTWSTTETPYTHPERVIVKHDNPQTVIVAKPGEIAYSTTAGAGPWTVALHHPTLIPVRMIQSLIRPELIYLSSVPSESDLNLWYSGDGGFSWNLDSIFTYRGFLHDIVMYPVPSDSIRGGDSFICGQGGDHVWGDPWDGFWNGYYGSQSRRYHWLKVSAASPVIQGHLKSVAIIPRPFPSSYHRLIVSDVPTTRDTLYRITSLDDPQRQPVFWDADSIRMVRSRRPNMGVFLATERGIFRSTDEGTTWEQKNFGLADTNIQAIALPDSGHKVFAVGASGSFVSMDDGDSWNAIVTSVADSPQRLPNSFWMAQNFPNPFNPTTIVTYAVPRKSHIQITVHTIVGQLVKTLVSTEKEPGIYQVPIDAAELASGVYLYRLRSDNQTITKRMLVLR